MPIPGLPLALGVALLSSGLLAQPPAQSAAPLAEGAEPLAGRLDTAVVAYRTLPREYRLDGIVEAVNRTTVSAQTSGQVEAILFDVDDFVDKGATVARLRDTEHRAGVAQAAADLKSASARLEQTRDEQARVAGLFEKRNVSASAMDQANADLAAAQAALDAAAARLEQAREQLDYTEIRAPYSGIVTHRHIEVGETASPGKPVMSGISLDQLRVAVDVPQSVIPAIRAGAPARVYVDGERAILAERITVFPFADLGSNTFKVRLDLPEGTQALFPGMFVKTGFAIGEREELAVPAAAVVWRSEVTAVYVLDERDRVRLRQVRLGRVLGDEIAILAGLEAGERVARDPIAAGILLKTQSAAPAPGNGG